VGAGLHSRGQARRQVRPIDTHRRIFTPRWQIDVRQTVRCVASHPCQQAIDVLSHLNSSLYTASGKPRDSRIAAIRSSISASAAMVASRAFVGASSGIMLVLPWGQSVVCELSAVAVSTLAESDPRPVNERLTCAIAMSKAQVLTA